MNPAPFVTMRGEHLRALVEGARSAGVSVLPLTASPDGIATPGTVLSDDHTRAYGGGAPASTSGEPSAPYLVDTGAFHRARRATEWDAGTVTLSHDVAGETAVTLGGVAVLRTPADAHPPGGIKSYPDLWGKRILNAGPWVSASLPVDAFRGALNTAASNPMYKARYEGWTYAVRIHAGRPGLFVDRRRIPGSTQLDEGGAGRAGAYFDTALLRKLRLMRGSALIATVSDSGDTGALRLQVQRYTPDGELWGEYILASLLAEKVGEVD